ncbi:hypothetical protein ABZV77_11555 [Streptomyces sp. NPDC004732]|uniref:hypothetical protein n=1 Tax=Streptomyces sp. NPDC004732 TaxID=3154290 RepID=UPI0033ACC6EF
MCSPLATLTELEARMGEPFADESARRQGTAALADASDFVRGYGNPRWGCDCNGPRIKPVGAVKAVALAMAERRMRNPENFVSEGAGEYNYRHAEQGSNGAAPSKQEVDLLERLSNKKGRLLTPTVTRAIRVNRHQLYPYGADTNSVISDY